MKKTVSPEARNKLRNLLREQLKQDYIPDLLVFAIEEWYEAQNTFTDLIMEGQEARKVCPECGLTNVYYKLTLKRRYVDAMALLHIAGEPLTFKELALRSARKKPETYYRYFTEARHWGFIEPTGEIVDRAAQFRITPKGVGFLTGTFSAPAYLWKKRGTDEILDTPPDGVPVPSISVREVNEEAADVINDRSHHMQEAAAVQSSIPIPT